MMRYEIRKGVQLEQVCGVYLLISSVDACPPCPYIRPANEIMAFYWQLLEKGYTEKQLLQAAIEEFDAPVEVLRSDLHQLLERFVTLGYLIRRTD